MLPGAAFREKHVLADGSGITLRFIRPEDNEGLRRAFARLSPRTRYQRFLAGTPELTDAMVKYLTEVDFEDHVAIVATRESLDLRHEEGLGVARFVRLKDEPHVAEAAVTVVDDVQGKGIGRVLLRALVRLARDRHIRTIRAEILSDNLQMRRILDAVDAVIRSDDGTTLVVDVPIWRATDLEAEPAHPLRRILRVAAESLSAVVTREAPRLLHRGA